MSRCGRLPDHYLAECWRPLRHLSILYFALARARLVDDHHPSDVQGGWPSQIRWGPDSVQQSVRLLLSGQLIGAAVVARSQLERWTENLAFNAGAKRAPGEAIEDYAARVWTKRPWELFRRDAAPSRIEVDERHIDPREVMRNLNQIVHAERHLETVEWANGAFEPPPPSDCVPAARTVSDALLLVSDRLSAAVVTLLEDLGESGLSSQLRHFRPFIPDAAISPLAACLWHANLLLRETGADTQVHEHAAKFEAVSRGERPEGRLYDDGEMMLLCFTYYRSRVLRHAMSAFDAEAERFGPRTQAHLMPNELPSVMISEMAASLASWLPPNSPARAASAVLSEAIRSSYWLWLEDDMRAMATLRVVLEQASRLRTWRLKPQQAARLEGRASPSRWLEKAGWGRLAPLNRALGEMSHFRVGVTWGAAFDLLVLLNPDAEPEEAPYTARGHALQAVTRLVGTEVREQTRNLDPKVADAFDAIAAEVRAGGPTVDNRLRRFLDHSQSLRSHNLPDTREERGPQG